MPASLPAEAGHIGLIEADGAELAVTCFEKDGGPAASPLSVDSQDARKIAEVLNELAYDVDRWLICLPNARTTESRELFGPRRIGVMLTTADHEGVVATYRALKGLSELGRRRVSAGGSGCPRRSACRCGISQAGRGERQFLHCGLETGSLLRPASDVSEQAVLHCHQNGQKPICEPGLHWRIIRDLMSNAVGPTLQPKSEQPKAMKLNISENSKMPAVDNSMPEVDRPAGRRERAVNLDAIIRQAARTGDGSPARFTRRCVRRRSLRWVRDQRLMLLAVAGADWGSCCRSGRRIAG